MRKLSTKLVASITTVRHATRMIAEGRYDMRVPPLAEPDMRRLGEDINALAVNLAESEKRRMRLIGDVATRCAFHWMRSRWLLGW